MTPQTATLKLDDVLTQVAKDKGIDKSVLVMTLEDAMQTAAKKHFGQDRALEAKFEADKGVVEIFQAINVVEQVSDPINAINQLTIDAARAKASLGEISDALEKVYGRYTAQIRTISGVYNTEAGTNEDIATARKLVEEFEKKEGRRPRILVAKMGQDGHDRGQKVISTAYADLGMDVDVGPLFQTPEEVARQAVESDVHVVGVSSLAAGHLTLVPALRQELDKLGREDLMIVVGGVIPAQDFDELREHGADAIYPPGTIIPAAAIDLLTKLNERLAD